MGELQLILLQHTKYGSQQSKYDSDDTKYGSTEIAENEDSRYAVNLLRSTPCAGDFLQVEPGVKMKDVLGKYEKHVGGGHVRLRHLMVRN